MNYDNITPNEVFRDRATFMGVGVTNALSGGSGYDVVLRLDGTYADKRTAEESARLLGVVIRNAIVQTPHLHAPDLVAALRQLERFQPGINQSTIDNP